MHSVCLFFAILRGCFFDVSAGGELMIDGGRDFMHLCTPSMLNMHGEFSTQL